jgi:hypothetical protein
LGPDFSPLVLGKRLYLETTEDCVDKLDWALQRIDGCARCTVSAFREGSDDVDTSIYAILKAIRNTVRSGQRLVPSAAEQKGTASADSKATRSPTSQAR